MYILEGNIGSGKSTLLKMICKYAPEIAVVLEPVAEWKKTIYGQSLLENFYTDSQRWAYTFETFTLLNRVKGYLDEQNKKADIKIIERSVYSGFYCFAQNSHEQGFMTKLEMHAYEQWFNFLIGNNQIPHGFIYFRASPEVSYERIKKRNRSAETSISFDYIQQIHNKHEQFLVNKKNVLPQLQNVPVLILDGNHEFETDEIIFQNYLQKIIDFVHQSSPSFAPLPSLKFRRAGECNISRGNAKKQY